MARRKMALVVDRKLVAAAKACESVAHSSVLGVRTSELEAHKLEPGARNYVPGVHKSEQVDHTCLEERCK